MSIVPESHADRLYNALAIFDKRDGSLGADIARSAREGYERSHPDMDEEGAWDEFDRLIALWNEAHRHHSPAYARMVRERNG